MSGRKGAGALYCLDTDASVDPAASRELSISNGLAWSLDEDVMYFIDTPTRQVVAYDYDADSGEIENERVVIEVPASEGLPDGMTIDAEGKLWIAMWDGWQVCRFDPVNGRMLESISVPVARVTSCAFGGPGLETMYITTARKGLRDNELAKQPLAGGLLPLPAGRGPASKRTTSRAERGAPAGDENVGFVAERASVWPVGRQALRARLQESPEESAAKSDSS